MKLVIVMMLAIQGLCLTDRALLSLFDSSTPQLLDLSQIDTQTIDCQYKGLVQLKDNLKLWSDFLQNKDTLEAETAKLNTLKSQLFYVQPDQHDAYKQLVNDFIEESKKDVSNDSGIFEKWRENQAEYLQEGAQELDSHEETQQSEEKFREVLGRVLDSHDKIIEQYTNPPIDINVITQKADQITTISGNCDQGGVTVTVQKPASSNENQPENQQNQNQAQSEVQQTENQVQSDVQQQAVEEPSQNQVEVGIFEQVDSTSQTQSDNSQQVFEQSEQQNVEQPQQAQIEQSSEQTSFFEVYDPEEQALVGQTA